MNKVFCLSLYVLFLLVLEGCSVSTPHASKSLANQTTQQPADIIYGNFDTDTLYALLVAEVAASRRDYKTTFDHYVEQAHHTKDPAVIKRATRIAQFFQAHQTTLNMGLLWLNHEPEHTEATAIVANAYLELGKPLKSLDYAEKLLHTSRNTDTLNNTSALAETIANLSKQSPPTLITALIQRFEQLHARYPSLVGIEVGLSILYQANGQLPKAQQFIQQALQQEPQRTSAIVQEIVLLQAIQNTTQAAGKLKTLLEKYPSNPRLRLLYARLLTQTDINEAYTQFTLLSQQSPKQLDLKFSRALLATELANTAVAKPLLEELLAAQYRPTQVHFYLGYVEETLQHWQAALQHYLAVKTGDNFLSSQNRAARIMIQQGNVNKGQDIFNQLRTHYPSRQEALYVAESSLLVELKHNTQGLLLLDTAINQFPDNHALRYNRSTLYERQDQLALMESDLRHILTLDPNSVSALNALGYFLTIRTQRYQEALTLITKAHTLRPDDAAILDSLGWVHFKLGNIDQAIGYLQQAFAIFPDPEVAAHLGEALWLKGKHQEAKNLWQTNLQNNPKAPEIMNTLKRLGISL